MVIETGWTRSTFFPVLFLRFNFSLPIFVEVKFKIRTVNRKFSFQREEDDIRYLEVEHNFSKLVSNRREISNIRKFRNWEDVMTRGASHFQPTIERNRSKISILLDLAEQRRRGVRIRIQNVPRAAWIVLWDTFRVLQKRKFWQNTDFNFRTKWFHSKLNERRINFANIFRQTNLSSSQYVQAVPKIF